MESFENAIKIFEALNFKCSEWFSCEISIAQKIDKRLVTNQKQILMSLKYLLRWSEQVNENVNFFLFCQAKNFIGCIQFWYNILQLKCNGIKSRFNDKPISRCFCWIVAASMVCVSVFCVGFMVQCTGVVLGFSVMVEVLWFAVCWSHHGQDGGDSESKCEEFHFDCFF